MWAFLFDRFFNFSSGTCWMSLSVNKRIKKKNIKLISKRKKAVV